MEGAFNESRTKDRSQGRTGIPAEGCSWKKPATKRWSSSLCFMRVTEGSKWSAGAVCILVQKLVRDSSLQIGAQEVRLFVADLERLD